MIKKLSVFLLALIMISLVFCVAQAEDDLPELTLDELIAWKMSTRPDHISEDMLEKVITGNLYEEYYGVIAAAAETPLRAFATCDRAMFQVGVTSTISVHPSGATAPYQYHIQPYSRPANSNDYYGSNGYYSSASTLSITPVFDDQYMVEFFIAASNGDYVEFYSKYETVTAASLSDVNTIGGKVKAVIASVVKSGMTDRQKALAVHEWLTHNAKYDQTGTNHDPDGVLLKGSGVCESYARAFQMFMSELGIPNVYIASDSLDHAWNMIYVDGGWYHVDVTWDDPVVRGKDIIVTGSESTKYFCVTDAFMEQDHTWNDYGLATPLSGTGPLYPDPAPVTVSNATLTTLTGRKFSALSSSGKPTLLFFAKVNCTNTTRMLSQLSGYDLSALNVVIVEGCGNGLESTKQFYSQYASGITGATMGYGAKNYMWTLIHSVEPSKTTVRTPAVFYISADKKFADYSFDYDSNLIAHIQAALGVTLQKTTFSGSRAVLPAGTTTIDAQAFLGTGAKLIEIPAGCTSIASNAFDSCSKLRVILNHSNVAITPPSGVVVTDIP